MKINNLIFLSAIFTAGISGIAIANEHGAEAEVKSGETSTVKKVVITKGMEKCYGIAKAGKNDCGAKNSKVSCAGNAKVDRDEDAFLLVPAGICDRIAGGIKK